MGRGDLTDEQWAVLELAVATGRRGGAATHLASRCDEFAGRYEATVLVAAINEWL